MYALLLEIEFPSNNVTELSVYCLQWSDLVLIMLCSYNSTEVNNGADRLAEQRTQLLESRRRVNNITHTCCACFFKLVTVYTFVGSVYSFSCRKRDRGISVTSCSCLENTYTLVFVCQEFEPSYVYSSFVII